MTCAGSRNHANYGDLIVFGNGVPRLKNYRLDGLGIGLAGEQRVCQPRFGMKRASHGLSTQKFLRFSVTIKRTQTSLSVSQVSDT